MTPRDDDASTRLKRALILPHAAGNPYQRLLYGEAQDSFDLQIANPRGLHRLEDGGFSVVHIHWDDRIFGRSRDPEDNKASLEAAMGVLTRFKTAGGRIVWTIHNRLPHKIADLNGFKAARQRLSDLADAIHVHADHARDHMVAAYGTAQDKIHVVPHPSYLGAYEPAETSLTRPLSEGPTRRILFFGTFRREEGVNEIPAVAAKLTKRGYDYDLKMYGEAVGSQARLLRLLSENSRIDLRTDRIPDKEIAEIFGASHAFLAPYRSLFTSETVMLAMTFGLPVIGPDVRALRETLPTPCHALLYDPDAPRGLIRSMIRIIQMPDEELAEYRRACFEFARVRAPWEVAPQIAKLFEK